MSVLKATIKKIEKGWTKGTLEDEEGYVCLLGGFRRATIEDPYADLELEEDYLADLMGPSTYREYRESIVRVVDVINEQYPDYFATKIANGEGHESWLVEPISAENQNALIVTFNDDADRTEDEVIAVLEKADAKEEV